MTVLRALLVLIFTLTAIAGPIPAQAEDRRPLLMRLFGLGSQESDTLPGVKVPTEVAPKKKTVRAPKPANPKKEDARRVVVIGDGLAAELAEGLDVAFADTPDLRIINRALRQSGLAVADDANWQTRIDKTLADDKPDALVVMMGLEDRIPLPVDGMETAFRLPEWEQVYAARTRRFLMLAREKGIPVYWVGLMPMAELDLTLDMAYLDEIYRQAASETFTTYIDVWDAFADETGAFTASGPDMAGQIRQLRLKDGIGFSQSGKRKLAFYAEQPLRGWLASGDTGPRLPPNAAAGGLVISLTDPTALADEDLLTGPLPIPEDGTALHRLIVAGEPLPARVGRVDHLPSRRLLR